MNWEAISAIAEVIGVGAVVVSLAYVAIQIRQNTNQLKGESIREINNAESELTAEVRGNHELFVIVVQASHDWNALKPQDQARANLFFHSYMRWCETCWNLDRQGALENRIYKSRESFILGFLGQPEGGQVWWRMWKGIFDPEFSEHMDSRFKELGENVPVLMDVPFYAKAHWQ